MLTVPQIIVLSPFESADQYIPSCASEAGALGIVDISYATNTLEAERFLRSASGAVGVRLSGPPLLPWDVLCDALASCQPDTVLLGSGCLEDDDVTRLIGGDSIILGEAVSCDEACRWIDRGADGVVIRGREGGGSTGDLSSPVILAQILEQHRDAKIWVRGGVGRHTARGLIAAGATGVVLDVQLALMPESDTSETVRRILSAPSLPRSIRRDGEQILPDARGLYSEIPRRERQIGDDALIAKLFSQYYGSVREAVADMAARIKQTADTWRSVNKLNLLDGRAARAQRTKSPFIQGPMTRVSDVPEFVKEVCDANALGTLALAVASPSQAEALLTQAEAVLQGRTWAVGMLGFLDEALVRRHLELVQQSSASAVVLAGGRPYQEKLLRDAGKQCFVHVPSADLLRTFVAAGARCFVFEGAECGGHIGPLYSLPLWELQVSVLLELVDDHKVAAEDLVIAMAGGIHDSSSVAMALLTAADLVEQGSAVSLLMGTAYSLTTEAVRTGAVTQDFCDVVTSATSSARLETAPGHTTRCAPTPLVEEIHAVRESKIRAGEPDQSIWRCLEEMTLGRLRMATKGLVREGEELRPVPVDKRHEGGLYMTGEVSLLIQSTSNTNELHEGILKGLNEVEERLDELSPSRRANVFEQDPDDQSSWGDGIAIVGMSGLFPGGGGIEEFWTHVLECDDLVTDVPDQRWDKEIFYDPGARNVPRADSARGAFLPAVPFDPVYFGIPPLSLTSIEPVQLLALEAARRALVDAGLTPGEVSETVSIVFGAESGSDLSAGISLRTGLPAFTGVLLDGFDAALPRLTGDSFPGMLANVVSGRVANRLDLSGSNFVVDAACASSLAALKAACHELILGDCDVALAGGADTHNGIGDFVMFSSVGALSKSGQSRPFDREADGIVLGEAVGCVVLKRVGDALRDGDRIYATIRGMGSSSDGRASGLTAPRPEGQRRALERAYRCAGADPASVELIEAHGTGTVLGDRIELQALTDFMTAHGADRGQCVVGSVKSQVGHTKCAAGLVGLVKAALSINQGVLPPTAMLASPNPIWDPGSSPFVFRGTAAPWPREPSARVAGVSAFGFGGTNYHCVLTGEHSKPRYLPDPERPVLTAIRGDSLESAQDVARAAVGVLSEGGSGSDVARMLSERYVSSSAPVQIAFTFRTTEDLSRALHVAVDGVTDPGVHRRSKSMPDTVRLAVLFSGQGSQRTSMARTILQRRPGLSWLVQDQGSLISRCFPPLRFADGEMEQDECAVRRTDRAQRLLAMAELAGWMAFSELGAEVSMLAGHSFGELVALAAGGSMSSSTLYGLARARGEAMRRTGDGGAMTALRAGIEDVTALLDRQGDSSLAIANINSSSQVVVGGPQERVEALERAATEAGIVSRRLSVSAAFHTQQMEPASAELAAAALEMVMAPPEVPVYRNAAATPYGDQDRVGEELASQLRSPVDFARMVRTMADDGATVFLEIGPGRVLSPLVTATTGLECLNLDLNAAADVLPDLAAHLLTRGINLNVGWLRRAMEPTSAIGPEYRGIVVDGMGVDTRGNDIEGLTRQPRPCVAIIESGVSSTGLSRATESPSSVSTSTVSQVGSSTYVQGGEVAESELRVSQTDELLGRPIALDLARAFERPMQLAVADQHQEESAEFHHSARRAPSLSERTGQMTTVNDVVLEYLNTSTKIADRQSEIVRTLMEGVSADKSGEVTEFNERRAEPDSRWLIEASAQQHAWPTSSDGILGDEIKAEDFQLNSDKESTHPSSSIPIVSEAMVDRHDDTPTLASDEVLRTADEVASTEVGHSVGDSVINVHDIVLSVIGERTGYPATMIEDELDLESDLGIDSIKRLEIAGDLVRECGLDVDSMNNNDLEDLSKSRTVAAMTQWLLTQRGVKGETLRSDQDSGPQQSTAESEVVDAQPFRLELRMSEALAPRPLDDGMSLRLVRTDRPEETSALASELGTLVHDPDLDEVPPGSVLIDFADDRGPDRELPGYFDTLKKLASTPGLEALLVVRRVTCDPIDRTPGRGADGMRGLMRTLALEVPDVLVQYTEVDLPDIDDATCVRRAMDFTYDHAPVHVVTDEGASSFELVPAPLDALVRTGSGPSDDIMGGLGAVGLSPGATFVFFGGGRGITSVVAQRLSALCPGYAYICGSSFPPRESDPRSVLGAETLVDLRRALQLEGLSDLGKIESEARRVLSEREIRETLVSLEASGSTAEYRRVDVRDAHAVEEFLASVAQERGRIDGVVFGSGINRDQLLSRTTRDQFEHVYCTKQDGIDNVIDGIDSCGLTPGFVIAFGSIAAVRGSRGQIGYAAGNDGMQSTLTRWGRERGVRTLTINWGPWAPQGIHSGMVSSELERSFLAGGRSLINPSAGADAVVNELSWGPRDCNSVVYLPRGWH